jgi:hypothetical protein
VTRAGLGVVPTLAEYYRAKAQECVACAMLVPEKKRLYKSWLASGLNSPNGLKSWFRVETTLGRLPALSRFGR